MDLPARIGRYEIEVVLGQGEMGRVLLARDTVLGRPVALKCLRDDLALPDDLRARLIDRLRQEARATAALSHPAIVTLHDMGEDDRVGLYLVYELVKGPTLREKLVDGALPPADVAQLARALGAALTHAHASGVVHRDVKPENVMLGPMGPKLTDFGFSQLAAVALGASAAPDLGTPAYSAPEALKSGAFSAAGDQFSLAATLYEALTGQRAFPGPDPVSIATRVASSKQPAPTSLLPSLRSFPHVDPIFDRALAKEARNRFGSCEAFGSVLASELDGSNAAFLQTPVPRSSIVPRATRRWQNTAALAAVAVIFLLAAAGRFRGGNEAADGVSLKRVASAFAATIGMARSATSAAPRHARPPASAPATSALDGGSETNVTPNMTPGVTSAVPLDAAASPSSTASNSASIPRVDP